jgi:hypothetical protein
MVHVDVVCLVSLCWFPFNVSLHTFLQVSCYILFFFCAVYAQNAIKNVKETLQHEGGLKNLAKILFVSGY